MSTLIAPRNPIVTLPDGRQLQVPWFVPSPRALKERERLLASRFFLVNISKGPAGEIWRCKRCKGKHRYLTLMCVEQPFSELTGGLYAYWHTIGASRAEAFLTDAEQARLTAIAQRMNPDTPDLATSHPETARRIATAETDADLGSIALGLLEPITPARAADLLKRINMRAGREILTLPGLTV